jgi:hypothetical protein
MFTDKFTTNTNWTVQQQEHIITFLFFNFTVDLVDPAIRHENGKQVARWNVDPSYEMVASNGGYQLPPNLVPITSGGGHVPHPASISAIRTHAFTTQPHPTSRHHPNGKQSLKKARSQQLTLWKKRARNSWLCEKSARSLYFPTAAPGQI